MRSRRATYYGEADDQSVSEHCPLRSGNKSQPKESHFNDIMGVCALLKKHSSSVGKKKSEGVHASDLARNEGFTFNGG